MAPESAELSKRERQIMDVIYAAREASAAQVVLALPDPPTQTAVRTLLGILERKGHLTHIKRGRQFIYRPTHPRRQAARSALRRLLTTFFDGSVEHALASYIADPKTRLSDDQLERLGDLIDQARRGGSAAGK